MTVAATLHLALVVFCFGAAITNPERSALAPIFVYFADMPISYACEAIRRIFHDALGESYTARMLTDASVYAILGTAWWSFIAWLLARLVTLLMPARKNDL